MATASLPVESEEMDCSVCHEHFQEPKFLTCGHLVCRQCLLSWLQAQAKGQCPLCRYPIINEQDRRSGKSLADIADSFLTDRAMAALVEAHRLLSEQHVCCACVNVAAVSMCMDCRDMFCQQCTKLHEKQAATKLHNTEKLTSLTEEKLAANYRQACAVHSDKLPEVFCSAHKVSVCLRCATTVHRQCPNVKDLEERVGEARVTLHDLTAILTARETEVGQTIRHLDKQLTDIDQQTQAAIAELTATFDDIEAAEKAGRRRLNDMIVKTSSDEKRSVGDVKNIHLSQRGKLTLHKRLLARSETIITRDDVTDMTPEMETLVKDLDRSISSQANIKVTSRIELAIDPAEVTRIKKALSELGKGKGSSFDDGTTARVHITKRINIGGWLLCVGVVTSSPDRLTVPDTACEGWESALAVYSACFFDHGDKERDYDIGKALDDLPVDSRVGVSLDPSRRLHLHVNGADQGVVPCRPLPDPCWALWELDRAYSEITSLPVRDLS